MSASYVREMMRSRKYMNRDGKEHLRIHIKKPTPEMLQKDREIFAAARKNPDIIY